MLSVRIEDCLRDTDEEKTHAKKMPVVKGKMVIVGDIAVGKTSILGRYVSNKFNRDQRSSIGVAYSTKTCHLEDDITLKLDIWDTAGQERFRSISSLFYRQCGAALIVYDITDKKSLDTVKDFWLKQIKQYATKKVIIGLAGNKMDMQSRRQIPLEDAKKFAEEHGLIHMETSAKTGENVKEIFMAIAHRVPGVVRDSSEAGDDEESGFKIIGTSVRRRLSKDKETGSCGC